MRNVSRITVTAAALLSVAGLAQGQDFPQAFDDINSLLAGAWFTQNNSQAPANAYFQGGNPFPAQASTGYLAINYASTSGVGSSQVGDINNWFVTPTLGLINGQQFTFYTRTVTANPYPDRLEVRLSTNGFSTNVGSTHLDVGDFTTLLLSVNPGLLPSPGGFPETWTQFTINLIGLPAGTTNGKIAFRYFVPNGGFLGANSNYIGIDTATYNGSVVAEPTGKCCLANGSCQTLTQNGCLAVAGVYGGNSVPCGSCPVFGFIEGATDVGDLPATAAQLNGTGSLTKIIGTIDLDDVDMFKIKVCGFPNFSATTTGGPTLDSVMYLFDLTGKGITKDDDVPGAPTSLVTDQFMLANSDVYLAISAYERDAVDASAGRLWNQTNPAAAYFPEWAPNGPAAANAVASWVNFTTPTTPGAAYHITLTGACFLGGPGSTCYANCDLSTGTPLLTANDFVCFINKYAANDSTANCDLSTGTPLLTANDFVCFISAYASNCS